MLILLSVYDRKVQYTEQHDEFTALKQNLQHSLVEFNLHSRYPLV